MHQMWQLQAPRSLKNYLHEAKEEKRRPKHRKIELEIQQNTEQQTRGSISVHFPHIDITRSTENKHSLRITPRDKGRKPPNKKEGEHV